MQLSTLGDAQAILTEPDCAHYQIRRKLGEGGFGQVYEAWDTRLCRSVALKRLSAAIAAPGPDRLLQEARHSAALRHAAFVKIYSIESNQAGPSIVMELVLGRTLNQFAGAAPMDRSQALDIVRQVAEAVQEAHGAHLVHGDIKPSNLMIEATGLVRILDFGLARQIDPLATQASATLEGVGTIAYMAPERLMGAPPDARSDVYALGVVLYELIAGARPFPSLQGLALAAAHLQNPSSAWPFGPAIDPASADLVRAMTEPDPAKRMPSMHALIEALIEGPRVAVAGAAAFITHSVIAPRGNAHEGSAPPAGLTQAPHARSILSSGPRPTLPSTLRAWCARHPARLLACALLLIALAVLGASAGRLDFPLPAPYSEAASMQAGAEALRTFDRNGNLASAIAHFTQVLEHNPEHAPALAGLSAAYALRYAGDGRDDVWLQRADGAAQQALKCDDQLADAHAALATVREYQGHSEQAWQSIEEALRLDPRNRLALIGKARMQTEQQKYADAERTLALAMQTYPQERRFADLLGWLRFAQADYGAAEAAFRLSLKLEPQAISAYANLSTVLLNRDQADQALAVLQQGLQIRPDARLYTNLGLVLFARADYSGAAHAFENAVSSAKGSPNDYLMWANLAETLHWIPGREAESRSAYQRTTALLGALLAHSPDHVARLSRMGLYTAQLGQKDSSSWTARALALAPSSPEVRFRAAVASELSGQRTAAIEHLVRARALGYSANLIASDPQLVALRRDARYQTMLLESK